jgi:hypothetical protein
MTALKTSLLASCLFLFFQATGMGFGEWSHTTKYGITLHNSYGSTFIEWKHNEVKNVGQWYYYKEHIVGITNTAHPHKETNEYFIIHQPTGSLYFTMDKQSWQQQLKVKSLNPFITRWYTDHDIFAIILMLMSLWFLTIPISLLILYYFIRLFIRSYKKNFSLKESDFQRLLSMLVLIAIIIFMYSSHSSI